MTDHAPIDAPIVEILNAYNPLEIKDILLHGSWRKAVHHKEWDKVEDVAQLYKEMFQQDAVGLYITPSMEFI